MHITGEQKVMMHNNAGRRTNGYHVQCDLCGGITVVSIRKNSVKCVYCGKEQQYLAILLLHYNPRR